MSDASTLVIDPRFCGPSASGNGGYTCGRLAQFVDGPARVRLLAPPPLGRTLQLRHEEGGVALYDGDARLAEARRNPAAPPPLPGPVPRRLAEAAADRFRGHEHHWYPRCFVCGPERAQGDGLRIFAGPVDGRAGVAAPWVPSPDLAGEDGFVQAPFLWAALDCPGAYTFELDDGQAMLLGELAAWILRPLQAGTPCVVVGIEESVDGRKHHTVTALHGPDGPVAVARGTWIEVPESVALSLA